MAGHRQMRVGDGALERYTPVFLAANPAIRRYSLLQRCDAPALGGGSTPQQTLATTLIAFDRDAVALERALRGSEPPVVARIDEDRLLIDLRTVHPREEHALASALRTALSATNPS